MFFRPIIFVLLFILSACGGGPTTQTPQQQPPSTGQPQGSTPSQNPKKTIDDLRKAVNDNDASEIKAICKDQPSLGAQLDPTSRSPLIILAATDDRKEAGIALIDDCDLPKFYKDSDGNSLLMLFLRAMWLKNRIPSFHPLAVKLIEKLPESELEIEDKNSVSALSWAIYIKNQEIAQAIVKKVPPLLSKKINKNFGGGKYTPTALAKEAGIILMIGFDNEYASSDGTKFTIKQKILAPTFIKSDGDFLTGKDVDQISFNEFQDVDYILLPDSHWFAKGFVNNPFKDIAKTIALARPSVWGFSLENKKEENDSVLFSKGAEVSKLNLPTIKQTDFDINFKNLKFLGQGGVGKVESFIHNGGEYALKTNAPEIADLEKLQFTRAVIEIYGGFELGKNKYLIMQKGEKSLDKMIRDKERIDNKLLVETIPRFISLTAAEKKLGISNSDIKPANMLLTSDGIKIIDISSATTNGYGGLESEKMARSLLDASTGFKSHGGYVTLDKYYEYTSPSYRETTIAASDYLSFWNRFICEKYKLKNNCSNVDQYDKLFPLFDRSQLRNFGENINEYFTKPGHPPDDTGTTDNKKGQYKTGEYKTGLPLPQLEDPAKIKWSDYFAEKDKMGPLFCKKLQDAKYNSLGGTGTFYSELRTKYQASCKYIAPDYKFNLVFGSDADPAFQEWMFDAFYPIVKLQTFQELARLFPYHTDDVFKLIIEDKYPGELNIQHLILELFKASF